MLQSKKIYGELLMIGIGTALFSYASRVNAETLVNPMQSTTLSEFLLKIIDIILVFALPIIVLYIMYAGYLFVTANGNSSQISDARNALLYAVVGGVIVLGARMILSVIQGTAAAL